MYVKKAMPETFRFHIRTFHHTYAHMLGTHASFPRIPTLWWSLSGETLDQWVWRSTPIAFFIRGLSNGLFALFWFFRTYVHGKQRLGPLYHEIGSGRPIAGVSTYRSRMLPSVNGPCMSVKKAMPGTFILNEPTFHHTYPHMLGTHASFPGIPMLRWSLSDETLDRRVRRSAPIAFSIRGLTNVHFSFFWFF
jgi:hypothetical protein